MYEQMVNLCIVDLCSRTFIFHTYLNSSCIVNVRLVPFIYDYLLSRFYEDISIIIS